MSANAECATAADAGDGIPGDHTGLPTIHGREPVFVTIKDAEAYFGLHRSRIYDLAGQGKLETRKAGRQTLIRVASLHRYLDSLPPAPIRPKQAPRRPRGRGRS